jgi:hypothetical protein
VRGQEELLICLVRDRLRSYSHGKCMVDLNRLRRGTVFWFPSALNRRHQKMLARSMSYASGQLALKNLFEGSS